MRSTAAFVVGIALLACVCGRALAGPRGTPVGTFSGCPVGLLPLPPPVTHYSATARGVALHFLDTSYAAMNRSHGSPLKLSHATTGRVLFVSRWLPSGWVKQECGMTTWQRSLVVAIRLPAMEYPNPKGPCNDCARVSFLLGKTNAGWTVWGRY